jgi:hypothetical protein
MQVGFVVSVSERAQESMDSEGGGGVVCVCVWRGSGERGLATCQTYDVCVVRREGQGFNTSLQPAVHSTHQGGSSVVVVVV